MADPAALRLAEILDEAPVDIPGMPAGKWAVYSVGCCWWTTDVRDSVHHEGGPPLPLCPSCGSVLMQAHAPSFIAHAVKNEAKYGDHGLAAFVAAHRVTPCHTSWNDYPTTTTGD